MTSLPISRVPDPMDAPTKNWGILAPGGIATAMAHALAAFTRQRVVAVGSRSQERADAFAAKFAVPKAYGSYEALVADADVDIVYVASPHSEHRAQALLAIEAGKAVLVEKAFARSAAEARDMVDAARAKGVAAMEAMWTRFLPRTDIVRQVLADGVLGEIVTLLADHGQALTHVPRLMRPELAGGALLDLGIYPVSFACFALGTPARVTATGQLTDTGVDAQDSICLDQFPGHPHAQALLNCALRSKTPTTAAICGADARLELDGDFYTPGAVRLVRDGQAVVSPPPPLTGHQGMAYEAAHFAQLVADGQAESPLLPLDETVAIMGVLDAVRQQVGVSFPGE
ncbi:MAG: Gfo/Idh/MocA family oxidoreductase [Propionibacteriaceae bacterium]|jgi:predicted dehydrogenase|nr:Gfo/Idh/MocA family oxidoreductase [Propionibacteriaceae bacterium]